MPTDVDALEAIRLAPADGWSSIADDSRAAIWVTAASVGDIARFEPAFTFPTGVAPDSVMNALRHTDHAAFVIFDKRERTVTIECRPRAGDRLYVSCQSRTYEIAAGLEHASSGIRSAPLSSRFVATWFANALRFGSFDHFLGSSPFEGITLVTRGVRAEIRLTTGENIISLLTEDADNPSSYSASVDDAIDQCRTALSDAIANATQGADVVAECSGGIDSGLTAVFASRITGSRFRGGVFADYPYYEFRKERRFAQCIATREGFALRQSSPRLSMLWGARNDIRMATIIAEPSLDLPFWGQALAAYDAVGECTSPVILTGQGGDLLFQERALAHSIATHPDWMSEAQWEIMSEDMERIYKWVGSPSGLSSGYGFDNPWMSRALGAIHHGAIYYSPLSSRAVIDSIMSLRWQLGQMPKKGKTTISGVQKPLAHAAFAEFLPENVWTRRWKVNFIGNYYRVWLKSGQDFVHLVERMSAYLEAVGIRPHAVIARVVEMAEGKRSSDRLLNALVTYLLWVDRFLAR